MSVSTAKLESLAIRRVHSAGINWDELKLLAKQIIIFGSHALASNTRRSDLDILCIGNGRTYKSDKLHIIWIPESRLHSKRWLGSELATHVSEYGIWIKGTNNWAHQKKPTRRTITQKKLKVLARLNAVNRHWDDLLPQFQTLQLTKLRRDLQRYQLMQQGEAPIPKTLLDKQWMKYKPSAGWGVLLNNRSDVSKRITKFLIARKLAKLAA